MQTLSKTKLSNNRLIKQKDLNTKVFNIESSAPLRVKDLVKGNIISELNVQHNIILK